MNDSRPLIIILVGFFLVVLGAVLAWLLVLHIIPSTLLLDLFTFAASTAGLYLGYIGGATYMKQQRSKRD